MPAWRATSCTRWLSGGISGSSARIVPLAGREIRTAAAAAALPDLLPFCLQAFLLCAASHVIHGKQGLLRAFHKPFATRAFDGRAAAGQRTELHLLLQHACGGLGARLDRLRCKSP
jgi:hypothetical protein